MRLFPITAALIAVAAPAFAAPATRHFSQDGEDYSYVARRAADGSVMLTGHAQRSGDAFALHVTGRSVDGTMGETPVAFRVSEDTAARLDREVAAATTADGTALAAN